MCQWLGKRKAVAPVQMDVVVNKRREALDVFWLDSHARGAKLVQRQAHVACVPQHDRVEHQSERTELIFLALAIRLA